MQEEQTTLKKFTATPNDEGVRLSRFVERVTESLPTSILYKSFRNKRIKVNGKKADAAYRLQPGDLVELYLNDEFFPAPTVNTAPAAKPSKAPYRVIWQDEKLAILYKPTGVLCHSDGGDTSLLESFTADLISKGEYLPQKANGFAPALCNRLDRGTEGLILCAKQYAALRDTNIAIQEGLVHKQYLCITTGTPPKGIHHAHHMRNMEKKTVRIFKTSKPGTKPICTEVKVLEQKGPLSLCLVTLHTGRTHQIRAHLAHLGTPIVGDRKYGGQAGAQGWNTQALCAYSLQFAKTIPGESTIHHLAGQSFIAQPNDLEAWWNTCHP